MIHELLSRLNFFQFDCDLSLRVYANPIFTLYRMEYQRLQYTLPLNETTLIFFPPQANAFEERRHEVSRAIQVRMKQAQYIGDLFLRRERLCLQPLSQNTMREMLVFFDAQHKISVRNTFTWSICRRDVRVLCRKPSRRLFSRIYLPLCPQK